MTINTSTIKLIADTAGFTRDMQLAENGIKSFDAGIGRIKTTAISMGTALLAAAGIGGMGAMLQRSMQLRDEQAKLADRLSITTQKVAGLALQAELTGVGADGMERALQKMSVGLQDAAAGTGEAQEAIKKLGLNVYELASKSPDEAFFAIADAMKTMTDENEKLNIVSDIFGAKAFGISAMLAEGRDGFNNAASAAENFGTAISRVDAAKLEAANDAFTLMKESVDGLATRIGVRLSPMLQEMAENFARNTTEMAKFFGFRTEQEELNYLLEERAGKLAEIAEQEGKMQTFAGANKIAGLKAEADALRVQINTILDKQKAEAQAFIESDKIRIAEETANAKRLEMAAKEKTAIEGKKTAIEKELQAMRDKRDFEKEMFAEMALEEESKLAWRRIYSDADIEALRIESENAEAARQRRNANIEEQIATEQWKNDTIRNMQMDAFSNAAALLRALGPEHKNAARAAIIIEKGLALASIKINTEVAAMRALAELGPIAGTAAAANIRALGMVSMGLVAAAGALQLSQVNSGSSGGSSGGGSGGGTAPSPTPYSNPNNVLPGQTQNSGSINIYIQGLADERIVNEMLVPALRDSIENRDLVFIRQGTRQFDALQS